MIRDTNTSDEAIIAQIKEVPQLINTKLRTGMNPFVEAVGQGRISVAKALSDMGADIHWTCAASEGNALNVAKAPQHADEVLALGVEIEKNLLLSKPFKNPAIVAALNNQKTMLFYWLNKTLSCIIADEKLFYILKDVYSKLDNLTSIQLCSGALRRIDGKNIEVRKKELRKISNARKKELLSLSMQGTAD